MSNRTPRIPTPDLDALKASAVEADTIALDLFNQALDLARKTGELRRRVEQAKDNVIRLEWRADGTGYAQDADDAHDASVRLAKLQADLHASMQKTIRAIEPWRAAQRAADEKAFKVVRDAMNGDSSASEAR